jgi:deoxycytidine triphosphate deaminase
MNLYSSNQLVKYIQNITHQDTQLHENSIDLSVDSIYRFTQAGSLDFGGSEFEPADTKIIEPQKANSDDDYGWWKLKSGHYKAVFNEQISLDENRLAIITPHDHARQAGLSANTAFITEGNPSFLTFSIPEGGCDIKENARLATAFILQV